MNIQNLILKDQPTTNRPTSNTSLSGDIAMTTAPTTNMRLLLMITGFRPNNSLRAPPRREKRPATPTVDATIASWKRNTNYEPHILAVSCGANGEFFFSPGFIKFNCFTRVRTSVLLINSHKFLPCNLIRLLYF